MPYIVVVDAGDRIVLDACWSSLCRAHLSLSRAQREILRTRFYRVTFRLFGVLRSYASVARFLRFSGQRHVFEHRPSAYPQSPALFRRALSFWPFEGCSVPENNYPPSCRPRQGSTRLRTKVVPVPTLSCTARSPCSQDDSFTLCGCET
jgi:hypothetical protein